MDSIFELKIQSDIAVVAVVVQNRTRLARVMVAVVKEENDFSANFILKAASGGDFSKQESFRKKSARLLAETNNRVLHG